MSCILVSTIVDEQIVFPPFVLTNYLCGVLRRRWCFLKFVDAVVMIIHWWFGWFWLSNLDAIVLRRVKIMALIEAWCLAILIILFLKVNLTEKGEGNMWWDLRSSIHYLILSNYRITCFSIYLTADSLKSVYSKSEMASFIKKNKICS